jgi:hypothetical protein
VLPDRTGDDEAAPVGPAEDVDHVGDDVAQDADVVDAHPTGAAQAVQPRQVGRAEPDGEHPGPVPLEQRPDVAQAVRRVSVYMISADSRTGMTSSGTPARASAAPTPRGTAVRRRR